jgi:hypothetical protein
MSPSKDISCGLQKSPWVNVSMSTELEENGGEMEDLIHYSTPLGENSGLSEEPTVEATVYHVNSNQAQNAKQQEESRAFETTEDHPEAVVAASAVAGGLLGCLVGGIVCAVIGSFGCAYTAKHKAGSCVGDCARAMGEVVINIQEKAVQLDERHHIVSSTKKAAGQSWETAKAKDIEYRVAEKSKNCLVTTGKTVIDFITHHRLVERTAEAAGRGWANVQSNTLAADSEGTTASSTSAGSGIHK